jgi:hypothetical protein
MFTLLIYAFFKNSIGVGAAFASPIKHFLIDIIPDLSADEFRKDSFRVFEYCIRIIN